MEVIFECRSEIQKLIHWTGHWRKATEDVEVESAGK